MTTAIDTKVIIALWGEDTDLSAAAQNALETAFHRGTLVKVAPVLSKLMAAPGGSEGFLNSFLEDTGIAVGWNLDEAVWRSAGRAFQSYVGRRRKQRDLATRRILADFLIGGSCLCSRLPTFDSGCTCV